MLTKNDLEAIKGIVQENNKVFGTILKVELAVTNKRVDAVERNIRELQKNTKDLQNNTLESHRSMQELEKSNLELQRSMKGIKQGQERMEQKIDKLDYEERIKQLEELAIVKKSKSSRNSC